MVVGLCRLLLRDPTEAEDAAQQTFLSAHRAVLSGVVPREPAAWLSAIARNECRARARARMREPLPETEVASDLPDPLAAAIRNSDLDAVWAAISELPRRQRRAFLLREVGGLSYQELGIALGASRPTVESLLFRARQNLRQVLATVNGFLVPLSLRDELSRLIPGFDPAGAAAAARLATIPLAAKVFAAGVGAGFVTVGAVELPSHHHSQRTQARPPAAASEPVAARGGPERAPRELAAFTAAPVAESGRAQERRHSGKSRPRRATTPVAAEPQREDDQTEAPEPAEPSDRQGTRGKGDEEQQQGQAQQNRGRGGEDTGGGDEDHGGSGGRGGGDGKHGDSGDD